MGNEPGKGSSGVLRRERHIPRDITDASPVTAAMVSLPTWLGNLPISS